jgi:hypothetical protein
MEKYALFISIGGLLIFTLLMASVVKHYQEQMAAKRLRIQRVMRGVDLIESLFARVTACPFPAELENLLRQDILNRYQQVRSIHRRYQGIEALLVEAEGQLQQVSPARKIAIDGMAQLNQVIAAYTETIGLLSEGWLLRPLTQEEMNGFVDLAATRRAEAFRAYNLQQANDLKERGDPHGAVEHYIGIKSFLREQGPDNAQAKSWYQEAERLKRELLESIESGE